MSQSDIQCPGCGRDLPAPLASDGGRPEERAQGHQEGPPQERPVPSQVPPITPSAPLQPVTPGYPPAPVPPPAPYAQGFYPPAQAAAYVPVAHPAAYGRAGTPTAAGKGVWFESLWSRGTPTMACLGLQCVSHLAIIALDAYVMVLLVHAAAGHHSTHQTTLVIQGIWGLIVGGHQWVLVLTAVLFLIWLHRAYANMPALGVPKADFTPGWAVGWFLIPGVNLVMPFFVARDLWRRSRPDGVPGNGTLLVGTWWVFTVVSIGAPFVLRALLMATVASDIGRIPLAMDRVLMDVVAAALRIAAAVLAIAVVRGISAMQETKHEQLGAEASRYVTS